MFGKASVKYEYHCPKGHISEYAWAANKNSGKLFCITCYASMLETWLEKDLGVPLVSKVEKTSGR